jgi:hypothetical protein
VIFSKAWNGEGSFFPMLGKSAGRSFQGLATTRLPVSQNLGWKSAPRSNQRSAFSHPVSRIPYPLLQP